MLHRRSVLKLNVQVLTRYIPVNSKMVRHCSGLNSVETITLLPFSPANVDTFACTLALAVCCSMLIAELPSRPLRADACAGTRLGHSLIGLDLSESAALLLSPFPPLLLASDGLAFSALPPPLSSADCLSSAPAFAFPLHAFAKSSNSARTTWHHSNPPQLL
jgi:hypothetical protein